MKIILKNCSIDVHGDWDEDITGDGKSLCQQITVDQ